MGSSTAPWTGWNGQVDRGTSGAQDGTGVTAVEDKHYIYSRLHMNFVLILFGSVLFSC